MTRNNNKNRPTVAVDAASPDFRGPSSQTQADHFISVINKARDYWYDAYFSLTPEQRADEDEFPLPDGHDPVDLFICRLFRFVNTCFRSKDPRKPDEGTSLVYWKEGERNVPDYYPATYCLYNSKICDQVTLTIYDDPEGHLRTGEWDEYAQWYREQVCHRGLFQTKDTDYTPVLTLFMGLNDSVPIVLGDGSWGFVDVGRVCSSDVQDRFAWIFSVWVADQMASGNFDVGVNFTSEWPLLTNWYGAIAYAATLIKDAKDRWAVFDDDAIFTFLTKFNNNVKYYTKRTDDDSNNEGNYDD